MMLLIASALACEPESCLAEAAEARAELRLADAAALLELACDAGDPDGCARLAFARFFGNGAERDPEGAMEQLAEACEQGSDYACVTRKLLDEEVDQQATEPWYRTLCEQEEATACYALGQSVLVRDAAIGGSWLVQGCEGGAGAACTALGGLYLRGEGLPLDEDKALALFGQGCERGSITGCLFVETLGPEFRSERVEALCDGGMEEACYELGRRAAVDEDLAASRGWHQRGCELESVLSCAQLGALLVDSPDAEDVERGRVLLEETCQQEEGGLACGIHAWLIMEGKLPGGPEEVGALAARGCELEDAWACYFHGGVLMGSDPAQGLLVLDHACALGMADACSIAAIEAPTPERLTTACDQGDSEACTLLAMAMLGEGDSQGAFRLLDEYCQQGVTYACFSQGLIWMDERNTPYDPLAGARRMGELCAEGHGDACAMYGVAHLEGKALPLDYGRALENFQRSCDLGTAFGCRLVGITYEGGLGVPKSRRKARKAFRKACALGDEDSC